jgi:uncharacterized lipoprotein YajG
MFLKQQQDPSLEAVMTLKSRTTYLAVACTAAAALLAGCAGQPTTVAMDSPAQTVQTMTVPKGTFLGGASAGEATALAQEVATSNNNAMAAYDVAQLPK